MVTEMPCPDTRILFVASDREDAAQADSEIAEWAAENGFAPAASSDRVYTLFATAGPARQWHLLERLAA